MIKINAENREDIIRSYCHELLSNMDFDTLYSFAFHSLVENKMSMTNNSLESEIIGYYPHILESGEVSV